MNRFYIFVILLLALCTSLFSQKKIIESDEAPSAIGPYSQAVLVGQTLYVSGQIAINPDNGELVLCTIEDETNQVMSNINAILKEAGFKMSDIVKTTIYLKNMKDYSEVNKVYTQIELLDKTFEMAKKIIGKGQQAIRLAIKAVKAVDEMSLMEGQNLEASLFALCCGTEDFKEGTSAFLEKRKADFKNK